MFYTYIWNFVNDKKKYFETSIIFKKKKIFLKSCMVFYVNYMNSW